MEFSELYEIAKSKATRWQLYNHAFVGKVGAAILTDKGNVYTGKDIDVPCSLGFCAEHSAISAMLNAGESRIVKLVAVSAKHGVFSPCGRCRELIYQINKENIHCEIMLKDRIVTLNELLPERWK